MALIHEVQHSKNILTFQMEPLHAVDDVSFKIEKVRRWGCW